LRAINFFAILEKFQDMQQVVPAKYKPVLRISHTIVPPERLNYNEFWNHVHKQVKPL